GDVGRPAGQIKRRGNLLRGFLPRPRRKEARGHGVQAAAKSEAGLVKAPAITALTNSYFRCAPLPAARRKHKSSARTFESCLREQPRCHSFESTLFEANQPSIARRWAKSSTEPWST